MDDPSVVFCRIPPFILSLSPGLPALQRLRWQGRASALTGELTSEQLVQLTVLQKLEQLDLPVAIIYGQVSERPHNFRGCGKLRAGEWVTPLKLTFRRTTQVQHAVHTFSTKRCSSRRCRSVSGGWCEHMVTQASMLAGFPGARTYIYVHSAVFGAARVPAW